VALETRAHETVRVWTRLERAYEQAGRKFDHLAQREIGGRMEQFARELKRDPQLNSVLRQRGQQLGVADEASPQLQATPATIALQLRQEADWLAESQVAQALAAREGFERGRETLGRVAFFEQRAQHDRRIVWAIGGGVALAGAILGTVLFMEVTRHAPDGRGWSAGWAARLLQADTVQAGYKLVGRNDPSIIAVVVRISALATPMPTSYTNARPRRHRPARNSDAPLGSNRRRLR
jgi:hypothetical protein